MTRHGTYVSYVIDRCRCDACRAANRTYEQERARRKIYEQTTPGAQPAYVDGDEVRAHLHTLMEAGMGWKRIAHAAGVGASTVYPILYGKLLNQPEHPEHRPPRVQVTRKVADKLLAVELDLADGARVDGNGTRLRLRALVAIGWPMAELARRLDMEPTNITRLIHGRSQITRATAGRVAALYEQLWDAPPSPTNGYQRRAVTLARRYALARSWSVPMGLDDDRLNDPNYRPHRRTAA